MLETFNELNSEERNDLINAISWITILIAGADGNIDTKEISWAEKISNIRGYSLPDGMSDYYRQVGKDFEEKLETMIASLPKNTEERQKMLIAKIASLNTILDKLPKNVSIDLYNSYKSFAKHVARSSGGFLGFFSVSSEEDDLLQLGMLDVREYED